MLRTVVPAADPVAWQQAAAGYAGVYAARTSNTTIDSDSSGGGGGGNESACFVDESHVRGNDVASGFLRL